MTNIVWILELRPCLRCARWSCQFLPCLQGSNGPAGKFRKRKPIHGQRAQSAVQGHIPCTTPFSNRGGTHRTRLYAPHKGSACTGFDLQ